MPVGCRSFLAILGGRGANERRYVVLDNTMATMGDLIGFEGYLNTSTPFSFREHNAVWKTDRRYHDYSFNNTELEVCPWKYPRFWGDDGLQYNDSDTAQMVSCRDSEFDQVRIMKLLPILSLSLIFTVRRNRSLRNLPRMAASNLQVCICAG